MKKNKILPLIIFPITIAPLLSLNITSCNKNQVSINSIKVSKLPTTVFYEFQTFSSEGLELEATDSNNQVTKVTSGFTTNWDGHTFENKDSGERTVIVAYKEKTCQYKITVYPTKDVPIEIKLSDLSKTSGITISNTSGKTLNQFEADITLNSSVSDKVLPNELYSLTEYGYEITNYTYTKNEDGTSAHLIVPEGYVLGILILK